MNLLFPSMINNGSRQREDSGVEFELSFHWQLITPEKLKSTAKLVITLHLFFVDNNAWLGLNFQHDLFCVDNNYRLELNTR